MNEWKKLISLNLALAMLISLIQPLPVYATDNVDNSEGVLTISGSGDMSNRLVAEESIDTSDLISSYGTGTDSTDASGVTLASSEETQDSDANVSPTTDPLSTDAQTASVVASGTCGDALAWALDDAGTLTISGTGPMHDFDVFDSPWYSYIYAIINVDIQEGITTVGEHAFQFCSNLTTVTTPTTLIEIGSFAFSECSSLMEIRFPEGLERIGHCAFQACALQEVFLPSSVAEIGDLSWAESAFCACDNLISFSVSADNPAFSSLDGVLFTKDMTTLIQYPANKSDTTYTVPSTVTEIFSRAFCDASNLISVTLSDNVTKLGESLFYNCSSLTSFEIPYGITVIPMSAFQNCTSLEEITIPVTVGTVQYNAFYNTNPKTVYYGGTENEWNSLTLGSNNYSLLAAEVVYGNSVAEFSGTFDYNKHWSLNLETGLLVISGTGAMSSEGKPWKDYRNAIRTVTISEGITEIHGSAFSNCSNLEAVSLPETLEVIDSTEFRDCALKSVYIPENVTWLGFCVFSGCDQMECFTVAETNTSYCSIDGVLYSKDLTSLIQYPAKKTDTSYTVPSGVTHISRTAFGNCSRLTSITLPSTITYIYDQAFSGCSSLRSIAIPDGISFIRNNTFYECASLEEITIPLSVTQIESYAFERADNLKTVNYAGTEASWASVAIHDGNDSLLTAEIIYGSSSVVSGTFGDNMTWSLDLDSGAMSISGIGAMPEMERTPWYSYRNLVQQLTVSEGITSLCEYAFGGSPNLHTVSLPSSLLAIDDSVFYGCSSLTSITVPENVSSIGSDVFDNCDSLSAIHVSEANRTYTSLDGVLYSKDQTVLLRYPEGKTAVSFALPAGVTVIEAFAFYNCPALMSVTLPEGLLTIAEHAFYNCTALTDILLPSGLTTIGLEAFGNCSLQTLTLPASIIDADNAFFTCPLTSIYVETGNKVYSSLDGVLFSEDMTTLIKYPEGKVLDAYAIPDGVTSLYQHSLCDASFSSVTLPDSLTQLAYAAFSGCSSLETITLPAGITQIPSLLFGRCSALHSVTLPYGIQSIGEHAFRYCESLTNIVIPEGVSTIEQSAFYYCSALASITLPLSLSSIGYDAFDGADALRSVIYAGTESTWQNIDIGEGNDALTSAKFTYGDVSELTGTCGTNITWAHDLATGTMTISGTGAMQEYDYGAYPWNTSMNSIQHLVVQDGITVLPDNAFDGASKLKTVQLPASLTSWAHSALFNCNALESVTVAAENTAYCSVDDVLYTKDMTTLLLYPAQKADASYIVPDTVTTIADCACSDADFSSVILPDGLVTIENVAFAECYNLTTVSFPSSVRELGSQAFFYCTALTDVTVSEGLSSISGQAFGGCSGLTTISLPSTITHIQSYSFDGADNLKTINYAGTEGSWNNITILHGNDPLYAATIVYGGISVEETGTFGNGLTWAFSMDTGVLTISGAGPMPDDGIWNLPWYKYQNNIISVVLSDGITHIGYEAFYSCSKLNTVDIPDSVISIGSSAFESCSSLTSVSIPANVTVIGSYAFSQCAALTSVTIPAKVSSIGERAFSTGEALTHILVDAENQDYSSDASGVLFDKERSLLIQFPIGSTLAEYTIPDSVTVIGSYSFRKCRTLTSVTLPNNLHTIDYSAFRDCDSLTTISIPDSVTTINGPAFYDCDNLVSLSLGKRVCSIGSSSFDYCEKLQSITVSEDNPYFYSKDGVLFAYGKENASAIGQVKVCDVTASTGNLFVYLPEENVPAIGDSLFYYPAGRNAETYTVPEGVTDILNSAFAGCSTLKSVTLPSTLQTLSDGAFNNCSSLEQFVIGENQFGFHTENGILYKDLSPTSRALVKYPDGRTAEAFTIPDDVWSADFGYLEHLSSLTVPQTVLHLNFHQHPGSIYYEGTSDMWSMLFDWSSGPRAQCTGDVNVFSGALSEQLNWEFDPATGTLTISGTGAMPDFPIESCSYYTDWGIAPWSLFSVSPREEITSVIIEEGVTSIGAYAFTTCHSIEAISIPSTVTSIGPCITAMLSERSRYGFDTPSSSVYLPSSVTTLKGNALSLFSGITLADDHPAFILQDNALLSKDGKTLIAFLGREMVNYTVPDGVTTIGEYAFYDSPSLRRVTLPNSVTTIQPFAFAHCDKLGSMIFPQSVQTIGKGAFWGCDRLTSLTVSNPLLQPDDYWFLTAIGGTSLTSVTFLGTEAEWAAAGAGFSAYYPQVTVNYGEAILVSGTCGEDLTWSLSHSGILTISGTGPMYEFGGNGNMPWFDYADSIYEIRIEEGVTSICDDAFLIWSDTVTKVSLPDTLECIGDYGLGGLRALSSIVIPKNVWHIGAFAFYDCESLASITVVDANETFSSVDGILYTKDLFELICCPQGKTGNIVLPSGVAIIGDRSFWQSSAESVTMQEGVVALYNHAFCGCSATAIYLPDSLETISWQALGCCEELVSIAIPVNVNDISSSAFLGSSKLEAIYVDDANAYYCDVDGILYTKDKTTLHTCPQAKGGTISIDSSTTVIGEYAFDCNPNIATVILPNGLEMIDDYAFNGSSLQSITLPDTLTYIGRDAFAGCSNMKTITIPGNVEHISSRAFEWCDLTSVTIEDGVISIGYSAFHHNSNLTALSLPDSVTTIEDYAFLSCSALTDVTLPAGLNTIGQGAFSNCDSLESLVIPASTTSISAGAFSDCAKLTDIQVTEGNTAYRALNGVLYNIDFTTLLSHPAGRSQEVVIPDTVTEIAYAAFSGSTALPAVQIPQSVHSLGEYAFSDCSSLESLSFTGLVSSIGKRTFFNCSSMTTVSLPTSLSDIGRLAFYNMDSLRTVYYAGTEALWNNVTIESGNDSLSNASIMYGGETIRKGICGENAMWSFDSQTYALTISGTGALYPYSRWTACAPSIRSVSIGAGITDISYFLSNCPSLSSITVDSENAYYYTVDGVLFRHTAATENGMSNKRVCDLKASSGNLIMYLPELTQSTAGKALIVYPAGSTADSYTIPNGVTAIQYDAFTGCSALKSLTLPSTLQSLTEDSFAGCGSLETLIIGENDSGFFTENGVLYQAIAPDAYALLTYPAGKTDSSFTIPDYVWSANFPYNINLVNLNVPQTMLCLNISSLPNLTDVSYAGTKAMWEYITKYPSYLVQCKEEATVFSGTVGENLTWEADPSTATLTISGTGAMPDFPAEKTSYSADWGVAPWNMLSQENDSVITAVVIDEGITSIGAYALVGFCELDSISLPSTLEKIGPWSSIAFYNWTFITSSNQVHIPASVTEIAGNTFNRFAGFTLAEDHPTFQIQDGALLTKDGKTLVAYFAHDRRSYTVPDGVTTIGAYAFFESSLTEIILPDSVTTIEEFAFCNADIHSITLPRNVQSIGIGAFWNCWLRELTISNPLMQPEDYWFLTDIGYIDIGTVYFNGTNTQWLTASAGFSDYDPAVDVICLGNTPFATTWATDGTSLVLSGHTEGVAHYIAAFYDDFGKMQHVLSYTAQEVLASVTAQIDGVDLSQYDVKIFRLDADYAPISDVLTP